MKILCSTYISSLHFLVNTISLAYMQKKKIEIESGVTKARAASQKDDVISIRFSDPHPFRNYAAAPSRNRGDLGRCNFWGERKRVASFY